MSIKFKTKNCNNKKNLQFSHFDCIYQKYCSILKNLDFEFSYEIFLHFWKIISYFFPLYTFYLSHDLHYDRTVFIIIIILVKDAGCLILQVSCMLHLNCIWRCAACFIFHLLSSMLHSVILSFQIAIIHCAFLYHCWYLYLVLLCSLKQL